MSSIIRNSAWLLLALALGCSGKKDPPADRKDGDSKPKPETKDSSKKSADGKSVKPPDRDGTQPVEEPPSDIRISGKAIRTEFRDDPRAAARKYKGKIIEVQSAVKDVGVSLTGEAYITLVGVIDPLELNLQCYTTDKEPWGKVAPGQTVKLRGRCEEVVGEGLLLQFRACAIHDVSGPQAIAVAADRLAEDYAKDATATAKMYDEKYLVLTGKVDRVEPIEAMNTARIVLKTKGMGISCIVDSGMLDQAKRLKPGQSVRLFGKQRPYSASEGIDLVDCLLFAMP